MTYKRPVIGMHRTGIEILKSRFLTSIALVTSVGEAREFIGVIRSEMPDASHHVYAFRIGYGKSVIEGMSDDGEPSGTAGPPTLAVLRGTDLGDIVLVTTRYFGGTKLGTGGLVRAYTESAQTALNELPTVYRRTVAVMGLIVPYTFYELTKRAIVEHQGEIIDESFTSVVDLIVHISQDIQNQLQVALLNLSGGQIEIVLLGVEDK